MATQNVKPKTQNILFSVSSVKSVGAILTFARQSPHLSPFQPQCTSSQQIFLKNSAQKYCAIEKVSIFAIGLQAGLKKRVSQPSPMTSKQSEPQLTPSL